MHEYEEYRRFTGPMELDKAVHTLEGILKGIAIDGKIDEKEVAFLNNWIDENSRVADLHPFNELVPIVNEAIKDGVIDDEERKDIIWLCDKLTTGRSYFNNATSDVQRLQAILSGIASDGEITKDELVGLRGWLDQHEHLRKCWPYDEVDSLITAVLGDQKVDEQEHKQLLSFFREFMAIADDRVLGNPQVIIDSEIRGVCAVCPEIEFKKRNFCFTGKSAKVTRKDLMKLITSIGGNFTNSLSQSVDYLVPIQKWEKVKISIKKRISR